MIPEAIQIRADICSACPAPCGWRDCAEAHADACAACPVGRWGVWDCDSAARPASSLPAPGGVTAPTGLRGLGDAVAIVAAPVGQALGLDPSRCGCGRRQEGLNVAVPFRPDADPGVVV